jgi:hypothetical protein
VTRTRVLVTLLIVVPLVALFYWVSEHTRWVEVRVPMPPRGEALTNPFYTAQRFVEALGARSAWDRRFTAPSSSSVIVLSSWHWDLSAPRREALERWVESGGRLVVDATLAGNRAEFERWSGILRRHETWDPQAQETEDEEEEDEDPGCPALEEVRGANTTRPARPTRYLVCSLARGSFLEAARPAEWTLADPAGAQVVRMPVGRGSVTLVNAAPFRQRELFDGDHPRLLVAAAQIGRGDEVHFLTEEEHPSLLALTWQHGAPVVTLTLAAIALAVWRGAVRFGPPLAPVQTARRSLAEQIRGTGRFVAGHGGPSLHAACVRALDERAARRVNGYARLSAHDRTAALARLTGFDPHALAVAIYHPDSHHAHELRRTIALLESARRRISIEHTRSLHVER